MIWMCRTSQVNYKPTYPFTRKTKSNPILIYISIFLTSEQRGKSKSRARANCANPPMAARQNPSFSGASETFTTCDSFNPPKANPH